MKIYKKFLCSAIAAFTVLSGIHITNSQALDLTAEFKSGAETPYYIVTQSGSHGSSSNPLNYKLIKRTGSTKWIKAFCMEPGVPLPKDVPLKPSEYTQKRLARLAYLGYYRQQNVKNYINTQALVYDELGDKVTYVSTENYDEFKEKVMKAYETFDTRPDFDATTQKIKAGTTITLTDKNKVFKDYQTFNFKKDGLTFDHTKGKNTLIVTADSTFTEAKTLRYSDATMEVNGGYKFESTSDVNIYYENELQDVCVFGYVDPITFRINFDVTPIQGYIQVTKTDAKTGLVVKQAGTEFEIVSGNSVVETIKTNANGVAKSGLLNYGTYIVREKKEPNNYTITTLTKEQGISEDGKVYEITVANEPVLGNITLSKTDAETGKTAQGDATLKGALYTLKANEDIKNPADGSVLYKNGETISVKTVGNSTYGDTGMKAVDNDINIKWANLPMGNYIVEETKVPEGYLIDDNQHKVALEKTSSSKALEVRNVDSKEQVIKGQLQVAKAGSDGQSGVMDGLEGIQFTMKLKSEVNSKGWDNAKTYSVITTDKTGRGISEKVPYGVYIVRETKTTQNYQPAGDFFVTIDEDKEIEYRMVNNAPFKAWLELVKKDTSGKLVKLSSATFKIKDSEGNYLKQKVGQSYVDEWTTDERGKVFLDNMVDHGTYYLEEIKTPEGFLIDEDIKFVVDSENKDIHFDEEGDPILTVTFINEKPTGTIELDKVFEATDNSVAPKKEGLKAKFKLTANLEVIDPANGSVIYKKGQQVINPDDKDGLYETDDNGHLIIKNLPLGTTGASYTLTEVETEDGYVLNKTQLVYDFDIENNTTKVYKKVHGLENKLTTAIFKKTDVGGKEVEGAKIQILDKDGKIIDEWISTKEEHIVRGLVLGQEYTMHEEAPSNGFVKATDITFTFSKDMQLTEMIDKVVTVTKTDITGGEEVEGASLVVTDKEGNIVDEWISGKEPHAVNGLEEGETYTLTETLSPDGYVKAESIEFTVSKEKVDEQIIMKDKVVTVSKTDITGGEEIEGASLVVTDKEGNIVDEWISTKDPHAVSGLEEGQTYTLTETLSPEDYIKAESITFTISEEKVNEHIIMKDKQVSIQKVDQLGNKVIGATLQVIDKETGDVVEEFVTEDNDFYLTDVEIGRTYILHESETPENYITAEDIEFTISSDENQVIVMTDIKTDIVSISKQDVSTKEELEGATLQIKDEEENIIEEWVSGKKPHEIVLEVGKTYTLTEITAPEGYLKAETITFTVEDNGTVLQKVVMYDEHAPVPTVVKTGDTTDVTLFVALLLGSAISLAVAHKMRKKENEDE